MDNLNEDELDRLAREELAKEARRGAERAKEVGAFGWVKPSGISTNKKFLGNVLVSTLRSYKRKRKHSHDHEQSSRRHRHKRYSDEHFRYYRHRSHRPHSPELINGGYFRYNDHKKYSFKSDNHRDEETDQDFKHSDNDQKKKLYNSDEIHEHQKMTDQNEDLQSEAKDNRKRKHKRKKRVKEKNNNKDGNSEIVDKRKIEDNAKRDNSEELSCVNDTHRRRKSSSIGEESLIEDIKKHKDSKKEDNPENIIDVVGDYLLEKRQKKKSKHKEKKSHKSKHKHKKHHKHKTEHNLE